MHGRTFTMFTFLKSGHGYAHFDNKCRVNIRVDSKFANNKKAVVK